VPSRDELELWAQVLSRLRLGPAPRGEEFDLCRRILVGAPGTDEAAQAARILLEGAMADATTALDDAQEIMRILRALDRQELNPGKILPPS